MTEYAPEIYRAKQMEIMQYIIYHNGSCRGMSCNGKPYIEWINRYSLNHGIECPLLHEDCMGSREKKVRLAKEWVLDNMSTSTRQDREEWKRYMRELYACKGPVRSMDEIRINDDK